MRRIRGCSSRHGLSPGPPSLVAVKEVLDSIADRMKLGAHRADMKRTLDMLWLNTERSEFDLAFRFDRLGSTRVEYAYNARCETVRERILAALREAGCDASMVQGLFHLIPRATTVVGFEWGEVGLLKAVLYFECLERYYPRSGLDDVLGRLREEYGISPGAPPDVPACRLSILAFEFRGKALRGSKLYFKAAQLGAALQGNAHGVSRSDAAERFALLSGGTPASFFLLARRFDEENRLRGIKVYKAFRGPRPGAGVLKDVLDETARFARWATGKASQKAVYRAALQQCKRKGVGAHPTALAYNVGRAPDEDYGNIYVAVG